MRCTSSSTLTLCTYVHQHCLGPTICCKCNILACHPNRHHLALAKIEFHLTLFYLTFQQICIMLQFQITFLSVCDVHINCILTYHTFSIHIRVIDVKVWGPSINPRGTLLVVDFSSENKLSSINFCILPCSQFWIQFASLLLYTIGSQLSMQELVKDLTKPNTSI